MNWNGMGLKFWAWIGLGWADFSIEIASFWGLGLSRLILLIRTTSPSGHLSCWFARPISFVSSVYSSKSYVYNIQTKPSHDLGEYIWGNLNIVNDNSEGYDELFCLTVCSLFSFPEHIFWFYHISLIFVTDNCLRKAFQLNGNK